MDRLEYIRIKTDRILDAMENSISCKLAYIHSYGVSQMAALLAKKRNLNIELACIAAMLHDISQYETGRLIDHAKESAKRAEEILKASDEFTEEEINIIVSAIAFHSDKQVKHGDYEELLKDSDVLAHYFYNVNVPINEQDKVRLFYLLEELHIS
ncbi:MAG: HD domain-containing protein [Erysipelotrichaceae bacterium]|jgi:uncharacterized protein|nr:HD domain-containing protein [Erysipelotrichaceae bacterium]